VRSPAGDLPGMTQGKLAAEHGRSSSLVSLVKQALNAEAPRPITRDLVSKSWHKAALKDGGLRDIRLHDLRHTAAAYWLLRGESLAYVQVQLGYTTAQTTMRYRHLEQRYMTRRADELDPLADREAVVR